MGRDSRALHRHVRLIAVGALLVLVTGVALANSVGVTPTGIRYRGTTPTGVSTTATLEARYTGTVNGTRHYNVPVPVSSGTVGALAKSALRKGAAGLGWYGLAKAAIEGAGWAIDELSKQVQVPGTEQEPLGPGMWCMYGQNFGAAGGNRVRCASAPRAAAFPQSPDGQNTAGNMRGSGLMREIQYNPAGYWIPVLFVEHDPPAHAENGNPGTEPVPITDQQLGDLLKSLPQVVNGVLVDPITGAPIRTPELTAAMNDLRKELEAAAGMDPGVDAEPVDPDTVQPFESDWPLFCGWAGTVCDFIDWMREEPPTEEKPEVPWDEQPIEQVQWTSGLGGGSCPAPVVVPINFNGHNSVVEFEFTPMCSFASTMRPILIAIAMLLAGFILAGLRENKGA